MSLNIPSSPDPFPLGLHALPLGLLDRACTQAGPTSSLERRVVQHTFTHASLINESSAAFTNFPTPADSCIGPACEAGLSIDAWKGYASPQIVNREYCGCSIGREYLLYDNESSVIFRFVIFMFQTISGPGFSVLLLWHGSVLYSVIVLSAPCGLGGWKNRPAPFHGQMS